MLPAQLKMKLLGRSISSFQVFGIIGFIGGVLLGLFVGKLLGVDLLIIMLMSLIGAVVFFLLTYISKAIKGGESIVYYHHEITILTLCTVALLILDVPVLIYLDITILGIGLFLAFGRIGCYSVGCCHGKPHRWGVVYGQQHVDAGFTWYYKGVTLFPVQLIESLFAFILVITAVIFLFNYRIPGSTLITYTVAYGSFRYIIEFFRGDSERPIWLGISEAQWTTVVLLGLTLFMSMIGWLPQFWWHTFIFVVFAVTSLFIIIFFRFHPSYYLFTPRHVSQIAAIVLNTEKLMLETLGETNKRIAVIATDRGLCVSGESNSKDAGITIQFTLSLRNGKKLRLNNVTKIARLIDRLSIQGKQIKIYQREAGIYHLLFQQ